MILLVIFKYKNVVHPFRQMVSTYSVNKNKEKIPYKHGGITAVTKSNTK